MSNRTLIGALTELAPGQVELAGWVETLRDQKRIQFIVLRDESGSVQVTYPRPAEDDSLADLVSTLTHGSFVRVRGQLKFDERVKLRGIEVLLESLEITSLADSETPIAEDSSIDKRLDWRFLDLRRPEIKLIFREQTTMNRKGQNSKY